MIITAIVVAYIACMCLVLAFLIGAGRGARASDPFANDARVERRKPVQEPVRAARPRVSLAPEVALAAD